MSYVSKFCYGLLVFFSAAILVGVGVGVLADERKIIEVGPADISPDELISRIHTISTTEIRSAIGYYVVRNFAKLDEEKLKRELDELNQTFAKQRKERMERDKKYGVITDVKKLEEEDGLTLVDIERKRKRDVYTAVARYYVDGSKYRIERVEVSDVDSLDKIKQDVLDNKVDLSAKNVIAWNGTITSRIVASRSAIADGDSGEKSTVNLNSDISKTQIAQMPDFLEYSRDLKNKAVFSLYKLQGMPFETLFARIDGERAVLLRCGDKNSIGLKHEDYALPDKGYVVTFGRIKIGGTVLAEDNYNDFVEVNDGSWLPTRISRSNYKIDSKGVPFLATKIELLAIEPPKLNVLIPNDTFDLTNTKEFREMPPLFIRPHEEQSVVDITKSDNSFLIRLTLVIVGIVSVVVGLLLARRKSGANTIIVLAIYCNLLLFNGCRRAETALDSDVVITDQGTIINYESGVIPVALPVGMGLKKTLVVKSMCSKQLEGITVSTTCGCAEASLADTKLEPGQSTTLSIDFRPENVNIRYERAVNVFIKCKENLRNNIIPLVYSHDVSASDLDVAIFPDKIIFDEFHSTDIVSNKQCVVQFSKHVSLDKVSVSTASTFLKVNLMKGSGPTNAILSVEISNPPVGRIDSLVKLQLQSDKHVLFREIPVTGRVLASYFCEPASVSVVDDGKDDIGVIVDVKVIRRNANASFPKIDVDGSWEFYSLVKVSDDQSVLKVISKRTKFEDVGYGTIKLYAADGKVDTVVPLVATAPQNN
ncbi:MAG: hypothetical protein LBQ66_12055 [Planctomycetaceae bacterium]|nr:hypothetical protein [Planctomycetaceae bacterium]